MDRENETFVTPAVTMNERTDGYDLMFKIPGVGKGETDLHVEDHTLTLKTRATRQNPAGFRLVMREFGTDNYAVSVELPERVDLATIKGSLADGVLKVTVRKLPETKARKIEIA